MALKATQIGSCKRCKADVKPHHACANCGFYKDRDILDVSRKTKRALSSAKAAATQSQKEETK